MGGFGLLTDGLLEIYFWGGPFEGAAEEIGEEKKGGAEELN